MGLFELFKKKPAAGPEKSDPLPIMADHLDGASPALRMAEAMQYYEMYMESIDIILETVYCKTFFYRYGFALENAQKILRLSRGLETETAARDMYDILIQEKTNIVNDFLFRCYDAGKIQYVKKDIVPYMADVPKESKKLLRMMVECEDLEKISEQRSAVEGLFAVLLGAQMLAGLGSDTRDSRYCNGDCGNCPPHYGYRYGRWYYGHGHQGGCERGGNGAHPAGHTAINRWKVVYNIRQSLFRKISAC